LDGDYGSAKFWECYALAASGATPNGMPHYKRIAQREARRDIAQAIKQGFAAAKHRAGKRGLPFDLTEEWAAAQIERQDFKCALTGIPFLAEHSDVKARIRPYAPSLDRIDCTGGYTVDNVQIVACAINMMLLDWGEEVFKRVAQGYRQVQRAGS